MKTKNKIRVLAICLILLAFTSCESLIDESSMTVSMTDAPALYTHVNVELEEVAVKYLDDWKGDKGWVALETKTGIYNLLDYRDGATVEIGSSDKMPSGQILLLRIKLGENNSLAFAGGARATLKLDDLYYNIDGVYIVLNSTIKYNQIMKIVLDFDAEESIVLESDGTYTLSPKITVKSVAQI